MSSVFCYLALPNKTALAKKCLNCASTSLRAMFSECGKWPEKYKKENRIDLEKRWINYLSKKWKTHVKRFDASTNVSSNAKEKFYCLSMFPYPSGKLHMGHVRVYTISDTMANFYRMQGKEVIHPMGWDSFGLPAENAALKNDLDPKEWTDKNISYMKKQLNDLNLFFDWNREISTCTPQYYKWTQYLFLKLFDAGLAYQKKGLVNWDPEDKTVLADEQVDDFGRSWRSGAVVERKLLKQWFLRTTKYSEALLESIDEIKEDFGIKAMQRHWIGELEGYFVDFKIQIDGKDTDNNFSVFCTHPELIPCASHINLHLNHAEELAVLFTDAGLDVTSSDLQNIPSGSVIKRISAINPFSLKLIPFVINDHYSEVYKSSNVLGIPSLNDTDASIATNSNLDYSTQTTISREDAIAKIKASGYGHGHVTSSGLRDWLISRQRRWGTPIPIVYCKEHGAVKVPDDQLPVLLPKYNESLEQWKKTPCPVCGNSAERETDTMDTFVDSSWYFMRFADPYNENEIFSKSKCDRMMPVDLYIGGKEHAILHLYYARFITHFCADIGLTRHREPFKQLLAQGVIKGKTYHLKDTGKYLPVDQVKETESGYIEASSGSEVEVEFEKMSKSKLNGVDPVDFVSEWGITLTRLFVLYAAAPFEEIHWDTKTDVIPGMMRWQMKMWRNVGRLLEAREVPANDEIDYDLEFDLAMQNNATIDKVTDLYRNSCVLSAAITLLMTLARYTANIKSSSIINSREFERSVCAQVIMAAPMMPHFSSELWSGLRSMKYKLTEHDWDKDVLDQKWPVVDEVEEPIVVDVFVNEKRCTKLRLPHDFMFENLEKVALTSYKVSRRIKSPISEIITGPKTVKIITVKKERAL